LAVLCVCRGTECVLINELIDEGDGGREREVERANGGVRLHCWPQLMA